MPGEITLAGLYLTAADYISGTHYSNFLGGPDLWTAVHAVASDKVAGPLAEGFRRHVGAAQTQHWRGDEKEAVRILRTLSHAAEPLPLLTELHAEHRMETARQVLRDTLDMSTGHDLDLVGLARHLAEQLARAEAENERLHAALKSKQGYPTTSWDLPADVEALVRDQLTGDGVGS